MAFTLEQVVPWGRTFQEYKDMFLLTENELKGRIAGFGDGPASFNCELTKIGGNIISFDPIYQFTKEQIGKRILEVKDVVMKQTEENYGNFVWDSIKNLKELEQTRMNAMNTFLEDYDIGKKEGRYRYHELPHKTVFDEDTFELGLSSHFLLLYPMLGEEFHKKALKEMLRICMEVRIFPLVNLDGKETELTKVIIDYFSEDYKVDIIKSNYQFQKNGTHMLSITKK